MRMLRASFVVLVLGACTVGPDYEPPEMAAPPAFLLSDVMAALNDGKDDLTPVDQWWQGFNDAMLDQMITTGLEANYDIAEALAFVNAAQAQARAAGADFRPQAGISAGPSGRDERPLDDLGDETSSASFDAGLDFAITPDLWGRGRREREAAISRLNAARARLRQVTLDTSVAIARNYLALRGNQRQLELLRESVALQEKTLKIVNARYQAGLAPELDVRRAETSVESLRASIPPLEQDLRSARNRLAVLAGAYPGLYEQALTPSAPVPDYGRAFPLSVPLDILNARPDVAEAEEILKEAVAGIGITAAAYYPQLTLQGQIGLGVSIASGGTDILIGALSALINQALTNGGERSASFDAAKANADAALARYALTLREAVEEVENALSAIKASRARQVSLGKAVAASARSFYQAEILYQRGLISFLNVVDAQRSLANAEQAMAREQTNYATLIADLFAALGTDVSAGD